MNSNNLQSDMYGIGIAMQAMYRMYEQASRGTGRSTVLYDLVKDGDMVIYKSLREANHDQYYLFKTRNIKKVMCVVAKDFSDVIKQVEKYKSNNVYFSHAWIEYQYQKAINNVFADISNMQEKLIKHHNVGKNEFLDFITSKFGV